MRGAESAGVSGLLATVLMEGENVLTMEKWLEHFQRGDQHRWRLVFVCENIKYIYIITSITRTSSSAAAASLTQPLELDMDGHIFNLYPELELFPFK